MVVVNVVLRMNTNSVTWDIALSIALYHHGGYLTLAQRHAEMVIKLDTELLLEYVHTVDINAHT